jgi:hypothetical protein
MVMAGRVADQLQSEKRRRKKKEQTTPKILESFIFRGPHGVDERVDEPNSTASAEF